MALVPVGLALLVLVVTQVINRESRCMAIRLLVLLLLYKVLLEHGRQSLDADALIESAAAVQQSEDLQVGQCRCKRNAH